MAKKVPMAFLGIISLKIFTAVIAQIDTTSRTVIVDTMELAIWGISNLREWDQDLMKEPSKNETTTIKEAMIIGETEAVTI